MIGRACTGMQEPAWVEVVASAQEPALAQALASAQEVA